MEYHRGTSWKAKLRVAVDKAIWSSVNYNKFLQKMQLAGYEVRQGKHLSFRAPEQKISHIQKRIENLESKQAATVREKQELLKKQKTLNIIRQNFTALLSEQSSQIYPSQRDNVQL
jgi:hypothetical protein